MVSAGSLTRLTLQWVMSSENVMQGSFLEILIQGTEPVPLGYALMGVLVDCSELPKLYRDTLHT